MLSLKLNLDRSLPLLHRLSRKHRVQVISLLLAASAVLLPALRTHAQTAPPSPPYDPAQVTIPLAPPVARAGITLYLENCAPCHGEQGNADGPVIADLPGPPTAFADPAATWSLSPGMLFHTTKFGRTEALMPPWRNQMTDDQIWNTVAYAWSLHTSESAVAAGAALYAESCASCHGVDGQGDGAEAEPGLAMPDFTDLSYVTFRSQADWLAGWQEAHPEIGEQWSTADQENVLETLRTFGYVPPWVALLQPGDGVISGVVRMGTTGAPVAAGQEVRLDAYVDFQPIATYTTTVGADGAFQFDKLMVDPSITYIASTGVDGMSYSSDLIQLNPSAATAAAQIAVYETTDDPAALRISRLHWIVDTQPGALVVAQIYAFGNDGERTYVGQRVDGVDEPVTVGLHIPPAAVELTFENGQLGDRFQRVGDQVFDTLPVAPGEATRQIVVQYALPYNGTSYDVAQEVLYPVDQMTMLVADMPGLQIDAPAMTSSGVQTIQERAYQLWGKSDFGPETVAVNMRGLLERNSISPSGATQGGLPPMPDWASWLVLGLVTAGLLAALGAALQRGNLAFNYTRRDLHQLRDGLIQQIAQVDDLRATDAISETEWLRRRSVLKAQLVDVMRRLDSGSAQNAASGV